MKHFLKVKETHFGILASIMFPVVFFVVWLTAYDGVYERVNQLEIAVVNEAGEAGEEIVEQLQANKDIFVVEKKNFKKAQIEMNQREIKMVMHIPETFPEQLQTQATGEIFFYINQSTASLGKQIVENMSIDITQQLNEQFFTFIIDELSETVPMLIAKEAEQPEAALQASEQVLYVLQEKLKQSVVFANMIKTNDKAGFASTMVPLLVVLASYIGAMLLSQHLQFTEEKIKHQHAQISLFLTRQLINVLVSIILSVLVVSLLLMFHADLEGGIVAIGLFQFVLFFSFLALSQIFVIAFKNPGMLLNIALVAIQLVSSGAIVPRELLSDFYQKLGGVLPGTYGANGYFTIVFGGGDIQSDFKILCMIIGVTLILSLLLVVIKGKIAARKRIT